MRSSTPTCERTSRRSARPPRFHDSEIAFVGHGIPGAAIGGRALGPGRYVAKIHGSDLEYAIRPQERYRELAREGLEAARAVVGPSIEALARCAELVPEMSDLARVVPPGVDVAAFRPRPRAEALREVASLLDEDPDTVRGRPSSLDAEVERALDARDEQGDRSAVRAHTTRTFRSPTRRLGSARSHDEDEPIVGYLGKLIPQKGVELLLEAQPALRSRDRRTRRGVRIGPGLARGADDRRSGEATGPPSSGCGTSAGSRWIHRRRPAPPSGPRRRHLHRPARPPVRAARARGHGRAGGALDPARRRSGWSPRRALPPARSRWSPGIPGSRRSRRALETDVGRPGLFSFEPGERRRATAGRGHRPLAFAADRRTRRASASRELVRGDALDVGTDGGETPRCGRTGAMTADASPAGRSAPSSGPSRPPRSASVATTPRCASGSAGVSAPSGARTSTRSSTSNPESRSSRIMSPWVRANSTAPSASGQSNRCMPK